MKFQNPNLKKNEQTHGYTCAWTDGQAKRNMPLNIFKVWDIKRFGTGVQGYDLICKD